jgi:predicted class III extradiol MEMO1 family dioxygenase
MGIDAGKNSADIVKVLELCRDVEAASAELYKYFAEIYSDHPELAALWRKTAKEEEDHAKQFVLALKMRREPFIDAIVIDGSKAENALKIVRSLNDMARKSPPGMLEALRAAIKLGATRAELVAYANSGDVTGDQREVVGYAGVVVS